jgi:hypothetical protein
MRRALLECGGKCSATPLLAERERSRACGLRPHSKEFRKLLFKTREEGYFQRLDTGILNGLPKEENK